MAPRIHFAPTLLLSRGYTHGSSGECVRSAGRGFREYLCVLARAHVHPRHPSRIEASDLVQQTLLEACQQQNRFRGQTDGELAAWLKQMLIHNLADGLRGCERAKRDVRRQRSLEASIEDSFSRAEDWLAAIQSSPSQQAIRIEEFLAWQTDWRNCPTISASRSSCIISRVGRWRRWPNTWDARSRRSPDCCTAA